MSMSMSVIRVPVGVPVFVSVRVPVSVRFLTSVLVPVIFSVPVSVLVPVSVSVPVNVSVPVIGCAEFALKIYSLRSELKRIWILFV
jgi:hypothetical protein